MMRKNKMMRAASGLLVATLLTTSVISGTFAKYTTSATGSDEARVAKWGFEAPATITMTDLFKNEYTDTTNGKTVLSTKDVIAPGTSSSVAFGFTYDTTSNTVDKPEVTYNFTISTEGSSIDSSIENNKSIVWSLDGVECTATENKSSWDVLLESIAKLSGADTVTVDNADTNKVSATKKWDYGTLPTGFYDDTPDGAKTHTISWKWKYDNSNDAEDTTMGNADTLAEVKLAITVKAEQVD